MRSPADGPNAEKLLRLGSRALTDSELLAILLHDQQSSVSAANVARTLLQDCRGLVGFAATSHRSPLIRSLGVTRSATLLACLELGRRIARAAIPTRDPMSSPGAVAQYLALQFAVPGQEVMGALYLDSRNRLMSEQEIYRGTLNRAAVEPRAVLKEGLLRDAAGFVLFHTHPSGDPSPSVEDLAFTRRVARSGEILGVRLVDHLILGAGDTWISLRQRGGW